jgi:DNA-binding HxlR family transcriptional regulator
VEHHHDAGTANAGTAGRRRPRDYRLTVAGSALVDLVDELKRWTEQHRTENDDDNEDDQ